MRARRSGICAMVVASLAAVALPTAADAKHKRPKTNATFEVTLSGSTASTWTYHRDNDKDDPCDASADGNGSQLLRWEATGPYRVTFRKPPKDDRNLYGTEGHPFVFVEPSGTMNALATAEREGDFTTHAGDIGPPELCGDNGGADPDYHPTPKDCGTRDGVFGLDLYFHDQYVDEDELIVPLPGSKVDGEKDKIRLQGSEYSWSGNKPAVRDTFENCPFFGDYPEDAGQLYISWGKLKEAQLFNRKRKRFVVSSDLTHTAGGTNWKAKSIATWNMRMKRVK
jgi:hypothetical protein